MALFHLGLHFPTVGIGAGRYRILSTTGEAQGEFPYPELELQLGGDSVFPDVFPGVIISRLGASYDYLTASVNALLLILEALDGIERAAEPQPSADFGRLHADFVRHAKAHSQYTRQLSVRVLRLADSFRTPPATVWAGIRRGADGCGDPFYFVLSHRDADRVVCEVRGPQAEVFLELADRAGALLPRWPAQPYPAVLSDVGAFARFCDTTRFPWTSRSGYVWNRGLVTDHRGNEARWLGLVLGRLTEHRLEYLDLVTPGGDATGLADGEPVNAVLTLRGTNPFAACARAIELADVIPNQPSPSPPHPQSGHTLVGPRSPISAEINDLIAEARRSCVDPVRQFTLVAIPDPAATGRVTVRVCQKDSPDVGQVRDGVFHWPLRCSKNCGDARIDDLGAFNFLALAPAEEPLTSFAVFSGRATAALLAAAPAWANVRSPNGVNTNWAATVLFGAPSVLSHSPEELTGTYILKDPWAASVTALNDILTPPPASQPATPVTADPSPRVRGDESGGTLVPTVNENEVKVLTALSDRPLVRLKIVEIGEAAHLSKQTVGAAISGLISKGLVERPEGKRQGATLTSNGKKYIASILNSSADHP